MDEDNPMQIDDAADALPTCKNVSGVSEGVREDVKLRMRAVIDIMISKKFARGQVMSTIDIGYYLEGWLEDYEAEHGDVLSEDEFGKFLDDLEEDLLQRNQIYEYGNWESYGMTVREFGLISSTERHMIKCRERERKDPDCVHTIFADTEFPVAEDGRYTRPV